MDKLTIGEIGSWLAFAVAFIGAIEFLALRMRKYIKLTMKDEIEPLREELKENTLNTLKNTICNDNIPMSERLDAGKRYIERGGNGGVKIYYHKLEEQYEERLQKGDKL